MVKFNKKKLTVFVIVMMLLSSALTFTGIHLYMSLTDKAVVSKEQYKTEHEIASKYAKLYVLQQKINKDFIWDTDENAQMENLYKSLVSSLGDEYSTYMTKEEFEKWAQYVTGTYEGIGVTFTVNDKNEIEIIDVNEKSPAKSAGLKAGDILLSVDGKTYTDLDSVREAIRGKEGTTLKIKYRRDNKEAEAEIVRGVIEERSVFSGEQDGKGYIRISKFEKETALQFKTEMSELENKGINSVVIDLRNNPGGIMESAIEIADYLLPECNIIYTKDKNNKKEYYNSDEKATKMNYVILVNEDTASAAEILTVAVKENGGGKVVGTTTFGKGIVQFTEMLNDGSALKLTTREYFSPKNNKIHKTGVTPDVEVKLPEGAKMDTQLLKAMEVLDK